MVSIRKVYPSCLLLPLFRHVLRAKKLFSNPPVICDAGASIGLHSVWFSFHLSSESIIYAFEPTPETVKKLSDHLDLNAVGNVHIIEAALSDRVGDIDFFIGDTHYESSLINTKAIPAQMKREKFKVQTITLDEFFYSGENNAPDLVKMDIEGGGVLALKGCTRLASEKRSLFLIESHTPDEDRAISDFLINYDYQAFRPSNQQWVTDRTGIYPEPEGVWGTVLACPTEICSYLSELSILPAHPLT